MSCPQFEDRLNDYAGGYLSGRARQEVDEHLLICTACRDELKALRELVEDLSSLPRSIEAPGEVWSATKTGLRGSGSSTIGRADLAAQSGGAEHRDPSGSSSLVVRQRWYFRPVPLAAAASLILVAAIAAGIVLKRAEIPSDPGLAADRALSGRTSGGPDVPDTPGPGPGEPADRIAPAGLVPPDLEATEAEFSRAAEDLLAALDAQKDRIPPETLVLIEENLRAISEAIIETHKAMESDPGNARLGRLMRAMYHTKMRLLQGAAVIQSS